MTSDAREIAEKLDHLNIAGENIKWYGHPRKRVWKLFTKPNMYMPYNLDTAFLVSYLR